MNHLMASDIFAEEGKKALCGMQINISLSSSMKKEKKKHMKFNEIT